MGFKKLTVLEDGKFINKNDECSLMIHLGDSTIAEDSERLFLFFKKLLGKLRKGESIAISCCRKKYKKNVHHIINNSGGFKKALSKEYNDLLDAALERSYETEFYITLMLSLKEENIHIFFKSHILIDEIKREFPYSYVLSKEERIKWINETFNLSYSPKDQTILEYVRASVKNSDGVLLLPNDMQCKTHVGKINVRKIINNPALKNILLEEDNIFKNIYSDKDSITTVLYTRRDKDKYAVSISHTKMGLCEKDEGLSLSKEKLHIDGLLGCLYKETSLFKSQSAKFHDALLLDSGMQQKMTVHGEDIIAFGLPCLKDEFFDPNGIYIGNNAQTGRPLLYDNNKCKNGLIAGLPGAGKTYFAREQIAFLLLDNNSPIFVISEDDDFEDLVEEFNGRNIELNYSDMGIAPDMINPFDMYTKGSNRDFIDWLNRKQHLIVSLIENLTKKDCSDRERALISQALKQMYESDFSQVNSLNYICPAFKDFEAALSFHCRYIADDPEVDHLLSAVRVLGTKSFLTGKTTIGYDNTNICVYNLKNLDMDDKTLAVNICMEHAIMSIESRKDINSVGRICIDGIYDRSKTGYLTKALKTSKESNTSIILMMYHRGDCEKRIFDNIDFQVLFGQAISDIDYETVPEEMYRYINQCAGNCLIISGDKKVATHIPYIKSLLHRKNKDF